MGFRRDDEDIHELWDREQREIVDRLLGMVEAREGAGLDLNPDDETVFSLHTNLVDIYGEQLGDNAKAAYHLVRAAQAGKLSPRDLYRLAKWKSLIAGKLQKALLEDALAADLDLFVLAVADSDWVGLEDELDELLLRRGSPFANLTERTTEQAFAGKMMAHEMFEIVNRLERLATLNPFRKRHLSDEWKEISDLWDRLVRLSEPPLHDRDIEALDTAQFVIVKTEAMLEKGREHVSGMREQVVHSKVLSVRMIWGLYALAVLAFSFIKVSDGDFFQGIVGGLFALGAGYFIGYLTWMVITMIALRQWFPSNNIRKYQDSYIQKLLD